MFVDDNRPQFHLTAPQNWINDPNAPVFWDGRYHLYYQHNPARPKWGNIHWGHASSADLVTWTDHGLALVPSEGADALGCWSGCAVDVGDRVEFYYTGVSGSATQVLQSVCLATGTGQLDRLEKYPGNPVIHTGDRNPAHRHYRDPFVFFDDDRQQWVLLLGSGIQERDGAQSGCVVAYTSSDRAAWSFAGVVYQRPAGDPELDTGPVWECPQLFKVADDWVLIVSVQLPRPATRGDGAVQVACPYAVWFIGTFDGVRFSPSSSGIVDAGGVLYAPATFRDPQGRRLMWAWVQEEANQDELDRQGYAGCLSLPREVTVQDGTLRFHVPVEVEQLWEPARNPLVETTLSPGDEVELSAKSPPGRARLELSTSDGLAGVVFGEDVAGRPLAVAVDGRGNCSRLVLLALGDGLTEVAAVELDSRPGSAIGFDLYLDGTVAEVVTTSGVSLTKRRATGEHPLTLTAWEGRARVTLARFDPLRASDRLPEVTVRSPGTVAAHAGSTAS